LWPNRSRISTGATPGFHRSSSGRTGWKTEPAGWRSGNKRQLERVAASSQSVGFQDGTAVMTYGFPPLRLASNNRGW
jgi:hypothetical protein